MKNRELSEIASLWIVLMVIAIGVVFAMGGCAHKQLQHSEMWKACAEHCADLGGLDPTVVEDEGHRGCMCAKPKEAT